LDPAGRLFFDGHERDDVVQYRKELLEVTKNLLYRKRHRDNLLPDAVTPREKRRKKPGTGAKHEAAIGFVLVFHT
jgi:hypothetical protein